MRGLLLALTGVAGLVAYSGSALAADPVVEAVYDWTGPYIGLQGGYGWGDTQPTYEFPEESGDVDYEGIVGGIEAGYNWQTGNIVFGLEADGSISGIDGSVVEPIGPNRPCNTPSLGCSADVDWFATARVRLGFALDNFLPFVSGGLAIGGVKGEFDSLPFVPLACYCNVDDTPIGWTIGGGLEWAATESWTLKAEYLYVNLGKPSIDGDNTLGTPGVGTDDYDFSVVRLGLNFSF